VKIGVSRQVVIPKKIHRELRLVPGDYLEVELLKGRVVMTPKALIDKETERRLRESLKDYAEGRSYGPFNSAKDLLADLHHRTAKHKSKKP